MMKRLLLLAIILLPLHVAAKPSFKIVLTIDHCTDTMLLMGYHYAQNTYVVDTAWRTGKGIFTFQGEQELFPGLYFITNGDRHYLEFVIYNEKPFFRFHTDEADWTRNMKVKGSVQNEIMFNYQQQSGNLYLQLNDASHRLDSATLADFRDKQYQRLDSLKLSLHTNYPTSMIAQMIYATKDIDVPTTDALGNTLSQRDRYDYFMQHYFDNIPLNDNFIIRTPKEIFYQRVTDYVDKYMKGLPPELIIPLLDSMIDRSEPAPEVFKWLVHTMTEKYLQSNIMVYDEVYVHLVQRYYQTGKAFWSSPTVIDEQVERATKWERLLVGRVAPELILFDTIHHPHSLHHTDGRYTLLVFWSPTCGHCREIIPALYNAFLELADSKDLRAFTILTEPDEQTVVKWKKFLLDHNMTDPRWISLNGGEANVDWREVYDIQTTPQIYLIDNTTHKFIAKKLNADLLREIGKHLK